MFKKRSFNPALPISSVSHLIEVFLKDERSIRKVRDGRFRATVLTRGGRVNSYSWRKFMQCLGKDTNNPKVTISEDCEISLETNPIC